MEHLTEKEFLTKFSLENSTFIGDTPSIIDFYAEWCGPCKKISPILENLEEKYKNVDFYKINVDDESNLAQLVHIKSIPTLMVCKPNATPLLLVGAYPKERIEAIINNII